MNCTFPLLLPRLTRTSGGGRNTICRTMSTTTSLRARVLADPSLPERTRADLMGGSAITRLGITSKLEYARKGNYKSGLKPFLTSALLQVDLGMLSAARNLDEKAVDMLRKVVGPRFKPMEVKQTRYRVKGCAGMTASELRPILTQYMGEVRSIAPSRQKNEYTVLFLNDQIAKGLQTTTIALPNTTLELIPARPYEGNVKFGVSKCTVVEFLAEHTDKSKLPVEATSYAKLTKCLDTLIIHLLDVREDGKGAFVMAFSSPEDRAVFAERFTKVVKSTVAEEQSPSITNLAGNIVRVYVGPYPSEGFIRSMDWWDLPSSSKKVDSISQDTRPSPPPLSLSAVQHVMTKFGQVKSCKADPTLGETVVLVEFQDKTMVSNANTALLAGQVHLQDGTLLKPTFLSRIVPTKPVQVSPRVLQDGRFTVALQGKAYVYRFNTEAEAALAARRLQGVLKDVADVTGPTPARRVEVPVNSRGYVNLTRRVRVSVPNPPPGTRAPKFEDLLLGARADMLRQLDQLVQLTRDGGGGGSDASPPVLGPLILPTKVGGFASHRMGKGGSGRGKSVTKQPGAEGAGTKFGAEKELVSVIERIQKNIKDGDSSSTAANKVDKE